jgi:hypothetical protein
MMVYMSNFLITIFKTLEIVQYQILSQKNFIPFEEIAFKVIIEYIYSVSYVV